VRTLLHLSDLHFGCADERLLAPLAGFARALAPDVVVVSGDLTQRARSRQFREARRFLDSLPQPRIVVPGNHDVPLHNVFSRFLRPRRKFRRYITDDVAPEFVDEEIAVLGIDTSRSLTIKNGRINERQMELLRSRLEPLGENIVKVVVSHHPFDLPAGHADSDLVGRAQLAMRVFARSGVDLLLAGHLHVSHAGDTAARYALGGYAALVVQAGTATSTRVRGEGNAFNVLRVESSRIDIERMVWQPGAADFACARREAFQRVDGAWSPVDG
jgi:3',5'-cyclic AMP phosphodiesterase CpdA